MSLSNGVIKVEIFFIRRHTADPVITAGYYTHKLAVLCSVFCDSYCGVASFQPLMQEYRLRSCPGLYLSLTQQNRPCMLLTFLIISACFSIGCEP